MKKLAILAALLAPLPAAADPHNFAASLTGWEEVPSVSTAARGTLTLRVSGANNQVDYTLSYAGLQAPVTQAHIHFAGVAVNGPIVVWLCGTSALPGPTGTPTCPASGSVSGTIVSSSVLASPAAQQLAAGDIARFINALRNSAGYANVHTVVSPGGEIRGQIF